jgi:hypothetical protein
MTPSVPTLPSYNISALYLFPSLSYQAAGSPFNAQVPRKDWIDPAAAAMVAAGYPSAMMSYNVYISTAGAIPVWTPNGLSITAAEAATANVPGPSDVPTTMPPSGPGWQAPMPAPARNLLPTETIQSLMGGTTWMVVNSANTPANPAATATSVDAEILSDLQKIETKLGIS